MTRRSSQGTASREQQYDRRCPVGAPRSVRLVFEGGERYVALGERIPARFLAHSGSLFHSPGGSSPSNSGSIGGGKYNRSGAHYEQLRARAMVMLLRHTALRISEVCTLRKDTVSWGRSETYLEGLKLVLDAPPLPRSAAQDGPYYFGTGRPRGAPWSGSPSGRCRPCSRNRA